MVGVGMGFENPFHLKFVRFDVFDYFLSRSGGGSAGLRVIVQYGVNDGAGGADSLVDDIGDGPSGFIEDAVVVLPDFGS